MRIEGWGRFENRIGEILHSLHKDPYEERIGWQESSIAPLLTDRFWPIAFDLAPIITHLGNLPC